jgi:hypothetical protein
LTMQIALIGLPMAYERAKTRFPCEQAGGE